MDNWCWAASAVAVSKFYNPSSSWEQFQLVEKAYGITGCISKKAPHCDLAHTAEAGLSIVGHFDRSVLGRATFDAVKREIDGGRPLLASIAGANSIGHLVVIYGYTSTKKIMISDPQKGIYMKQHSQFPHIDEPGATWARSVFTKR